MSIRTTRWISPASWSRRNAWHMALMSLASAALSTSALHAQAAVSGRVITAADKRPVADAQISIEALKRAASSDSTGAFLLADLAPGRYLITVRKLGFKPFSTMASILSADGPEYEFALIGAPTELGKVEVRANMVSGAFAEFEDRRARRIGRYLTAEDFDRNVGRAVADVLASIPGVDIVRGRGNEAWYGSRRGTETLLLSRKLRDEDKQRGANGDAGMCYATVVLNGQIVFAGDHNEPLFDLNSINPRDIKGVEVYTGTANAPQIWLTGRGGCGVIAIWLK